MTKNSHKSSLSNSQPLTKKIGFWTLFKKFKFRVIRHFLVSTLRTAWSLVLTAPIVALFQKEKISTGYNYAEILIPEKIRQQSLFRKISLTQGQFIVIGLLLVVGYVFIYYWDYLWEEELRIRGGHYAKNLLLNKFRRLPFEEKQKQKDQINKLIENDTWEIGSYWEHIPNHIFHSVLMIVGLLFFYWERFEVMTSSAIWFSLFWLGLLNAVVYFFTRKILQNEKKYKKRQDKEWKIINKERSNINLVESMGLTADYKTKQEKITQENEKLALGFSRTKSLSKTVPNNLLIDFYVFLLLWLSGSSFNGVVLFTFWEIFVNFRGIFQCLWDYADYASSRSRINNFLNLPEKDDNLKGVKLDLGIPIKSIKFENISFRYAGQKEWIIRHYTHTFSPGRLNFLRGKNGTGKSTKLYLLLGVIKPQEGKIIIELENKQTYELHQDINLASWRTNSVAYCAHENLVEEGSTGQRQLANIDQVLSGKKDSQIFLFDEADNALDQDNQEQIQGKIRELSKTKIVIYIKH